ncbi:MATE family efflux transporter [Kocuria sp. HSID16901]|uniref:MATE family efflux transporter n=1 Tax=Kocuria sp. HSID16901 TaxID=2419505 RepID=UPI0009E60440|nr:MATE family efflux transporter [Kocuria sp. HSID16901]MCT1366956.1 MATE family efflux transporter [Rothia sp. p3-SID1597]RUQ20041.1 MATE family efflux transporter [Kocuria sp. HSID16901]
MNPEPSHPQSDATSEPSAAASTGPGLNRQIVRLALPAFGALIAEPLFILADTAIVGHLGTHQLAGLSVAGTVVQTVIGLMIFLSYSTTPAVARFFGAGKLAAAYEKGRDGLWVALALGIVLAVVGWILAPTVLAAMGAEGATLDHAIDYMRWSMPGLPGMLIVLASLGVLRGLQDTKTPLYVAGVGAAVNVVLNWLLVFPGGLGVAGSAMGTSLVQWGMAAVYLVMIVGGSRKHGVRWGTSWAGVGSILSVGSWLMLRTAAMRAAMMLTIFVVTHQGPTNLASYQLTMSLFGFMAFGLDALAIAAQALLGKEMGARDVTQEAGRRQVRHLMNRLIRWALGFGVITGLICPIIGFGLGWAFTPDLEVRHLFALAMIIVAIGQPLASYVFILDGVLIGAQDARYLALASTISLVVYAPILGAVYWASADADLSMDTWGFLWIWIAYAGGFMGLRALTLGWRSRTDVWIRA